MNQELWHKFDKLRGLQISGLEGLAEFFQREGIRFASNDIGTWIQFFAARFGRIAGVINVPEWLAGIFAARPQSATANSA